MLPSIRIESWDHWTRVYNDASVWRGLIDAICAREGIGYRQMHPASANTNAVFVLDRAFALKIYSPFWDEFDFERTLLDALQSQAEVPTPEIAGHGHIADAGGVSWAYLITRYCPARPYSEMRHELADEDALSLAAQLGRMVCALHMLDASQYANTATERAWTDLVAERRRAAIDELVQAGVLATTIVSTLESLLDQAIETDRRESRVVVHGDLGPDHVLCAPAGNGWEIEALIDFGDAKIGQREYEWMPLWLGFCKRDASLARELLNAYDPDLINNPDFPKRTIAWTLLHDFGSDALKQLWHERGQPAPIESIGALQELLCPDSIFR